MDASYLETVTRYQWVNSGSIKGKRKGRLVPIDKTTGPVTILARWGKGGGPKNVLVRRASGEEVIRPFRGLRKILAA
jgi:acetyl esterase